MQNNAGDDATLGKLSALADVLARTGPCAVAVSGGVDSMTLAVVAHRQLGAQGVRMFHAVSAAVPGEATERVQGYVDRTLVVRWPGLRA